MRACALVRSALVWTVAAGLAACAADPESGEMVVGLSAAKGGGTGPSVQSADPPYGHQGDAGVAVLITGSGFDQKSVATWERNGAPDPKITVHGTRFISSSQLEATISIAGDAQLTFYDIAITTGAGRKGIGTEMFEVTTATAIPGGSDAMAVNDAGRIVGRNGNGIYTYDVPTQVMRSIGYEGIPRAIDQSGTTISGGTDAPLIWTFSGGWTQQELPSLGNGGTALGLASDATGAAAVIGGWVRGAAGHQPAKWTRNSTGGWALTLLTLPAGIAVGVARNVNLAGMAVGFHGSSCCYALAWDAAGNGTVLQPLVPGATAAAHDINSTGTIAVGKSGIGKYSGGAPLRAVAWTRTSPNDPWPAPVPLDSDTCDGVAEGINDAGIIVGVSCSRPVAWRSNGSGGYTRVFLGELGSMNCGTNCVVRGVNNAATPTAVGTIGANSPKNSAQGVFWTGF